MALLVQLTNAGVAMMAIATGPIVLDGFKLGSDYGYIPDPAQTDIQGSLVYSGLPSTPFVEDANYVLYAVNLGSDLGPFNYGEVGLFKGTTLFAICVFETEMTKLPKNVNTDTGGNVIIDIHTPITDPNYAMWADVTQSNSFKLNVVNAPHLLPKARGANPNLVMVKPPNNQSPGFMAYTDRQNVWQYENYTKVGVLTVISATTTSVVVDATEAQDVLGQNEIYSDGEVLLQFGDNDLIGISRYCSRKLTNGVNSQLNLGVAVGLTPAVGDSVFVYVPNPSFQNATDSVAGVVKLMRVADFPSSSDNSAVTAAYVAEAAGGGVAAQDALDFDPVDLERFLKAKRFVDDFVLDGVTGKVYVKEASLTVSGKIALASEAEAIAGMDDGKAVTPLTLAQVLSTFASGVVDRYVTGLAGYNSTTHALVLQLNGGTTVEIPMTAVISDLSGSLPAASTLAAGISRYASNAEALAGTLWSAVVTPASLAYTLANTDPDDMFGP